jgi:hypothetical protein
MELFRLTAGAQTGHLQRYRFGTEGFGARCIVYRGGYRRVRQFQNIAAGAADKKHTCVMFACMGTTNKRV